MTTDFKATTLVLLADELKRRKINSFTTVNNRLTVAINGGEVMLSVWEPVQSGRVVNQSVHAAVRPYGLQREQSWKKNKDGFINIKLIGDYVERAVKAIKARAQKEREIRAGFKANEIEEKRLVGLYLDSPYAAVDATHIPGEFAFSIALRRKLSAAQIEALAPLVRSIQEIVK